LGLVSDYNLILVQGTHSLYILWNIGYERVIFWYAMKY
jgi:hypothetical protein